jgi:hypothetical protein
VTPCAGALTGIGARTQPTSHVPPHRQGSRLGRVMGCKETTQSSHIQHTR